MKEVETVVEVICKACFPYICTHWEVPPCERIKLCKALADSVDEITNAYKLAGYLPVEEAHKTEQPDLREAVAQYLFYFKHPIMSGESGSDGTYNVKWSDIPEIERESYRKSANKFLSIP